MIASAVEKRSSIGRRRRPSSTLDKEKDRTNEGSWKRLTTEQRVALLDHELQHFAVQVDDDGRVKRDTAGRPKLASRDHDHQFGWFDVVAERHGGNSIESLQAQRFFDSHGQVYLAGFAPEITAN